MNAKMNTFVDFTIQSDPTYLAPIALVSECLVVVANILWVLCLFLLLR